MIFDKQAQLLGLNLKLDTHLHELFTFLTKQLKLCILIGHELLEVCKFPCFRLELLLVTSYAFFTYLKSRDLVVQNL